MKISFFILFIIVLIIITPIPVKISVFYEKQDLLVKLYNINLISINSNGTNISIRLHKLINKTISKKDTLDTRKFFSIKFLKILSRNLKKNKLKPTIKISGFMNYSLGDSFNTAIFYGIFSSFLAFLSKSLYIAFKLKKSSISINPIFRDNYFCNINFECILYISLGKFIYMLAIILKSIIKYKEVTLLRGNYEQRTSN